MRRGQIKWWRLGLVLAVVAAIVVLAVETNAFLVMILTVLAIGTAGGVMQERERKAKRVAADAAALRPYEPGAELVQVREYASAPEYETDAQERIAAGWSIEGQSIENGTVAAGGTAAKAVVFLPWALLSPSRKSGKVTVTWVRRP